MKTWTKVGDEWGIKSDVELKEGEEVEVSKRDGSVKKAKAGRLVHQGAGKYGTFYIYTVKRKKQTVECPACKGEIDLTDGIYWTAVLGPNQRVNYCIGCVGLKPETVARQKEAAA